MKVTPIMTDNQPESVSTVYYRFSADLDQFEIWLSKSHIEDGCGRIECLRPYASDTIVPPDHDVQREWHFGISDQDFDLDPDQYSDLDIGQCYRWKFLLKIVAASYSPGWVSVEVHTFSNDEVTLCVANNLGQWLHRRYGASSLADIPPSSTTSTESTTQAEQPATPSGGDEPTKSAQLDLTERETSITLPDLKNIPKWGEGWIPDDYFDWFYRRKLAGNNNTIQEIAEQAGIKPGTLYNLHPDYKAQYEKKQRPDKKSRFAGEK